jgi:hypothetical protein
MENFSISISDSEKQLVDLIQPSIEHGPWIAGGAVLRWLENRPLKNHDLDVFCKTAEQYQEVLNRLKAAQNVLWCRLKYSSPNAETWDGTVSHGVDRTKYAIQIIKAPRLSIEALFEQFDIRACKMVTDGTTVIAAEGARLDFENKNITLCEPLRPYCIQRLVKYMSYGYDPDWDVVQYIVNSAQFPEESVADAYIDI